MGKVNLKAQLLSDEDNLNIKACGIKADNKIVYKENDVTVTILLFDNKIEMNRSCSDYKINLSFVKGKNTISTYQVFGGNKVFELETVTNKLNMNDNIIEINYVLEGSTFKYKLEMEDL